MRLHSLLAKVLPTPLNIVPLPLIVAAIIVIGIDTPLAHADSLSAVASVSVPGCMDSDTLTQPGSIDLLCGTVGSNSPFATFSADLGQSSGEVSYLGIGTTSPPLLIGMIDATIDIAGEIMAPGNSGTSTITLEFKGSESQAAPMGCSLTFDGQITDCAVTVGFGNPGTEDLKFVVQNGQAYNYDLKLMADQTLMSQISQTTFQYTLPDVIPEPVPEPVSLVLLLTGFAPLVFRRKYRR
jgi:hypothetical protein